MFLAAPSCLFLRTRLNRCRSRCTCGVCPCLLRRLAVVNPMKPRSDLSFERCLPCQDHQSRCSPNKQRRRYRAKHIHENAPIVHQQLCGLSAGLHFVASSDMMDLCSYPKPTIPVIPPAHECEPALVTAHVKDEPTLTSTAFTPDPRFTSCGAVCCVVEPIPSSPFEFLPQQ